MTPEQLIEFIGSKRYLRSDLRQVESVELVQARILQEHYTKSKERLLQRLNTWAATGTFTETRLKLTLAALNDELKALEGRTGERILIGGEMMTEQAADHTLRELSNMEKQFKGAATPIPIAAIDLSLEKETYLINRYEASLKAYSGQLRAQIEQKLANAVVDRQTSLQAVDHIRQVMGLENWKVARIARTELHNIYNLSKIKNFRELRATYVPDIMKGLFHPMDRRTADDSKILKEINPVIPVDAKFKYRYNKEVREFLAPPDRPNDRAILIPVRGEFLK